MQRPMTLPSVLQLIDQNSTSPYIDYDFDARLLRRAKAGLNNLDIPISTSNLLTVKNVFDKHGIKFCLLFGTLLGAIRDSNFISHDTDTDICILDHDLTPLSHALSELLSQDFEIIRCKHPGDLITIMRKDEYIDIGVLSPGTDESKRNYLSYQNNRIYDLAFNNLTYYDFLGTKFLVPTNYTQHLINWYGSSWRRPLKNSPARSFDFGFYDRVKLVIKILVNLIRELFSNLI